ncbi:alpha/beta hydrolase family protein [Aminipila terrae]|uniref:Alpha/beta fold hydrolase n=1 Tax=Aminipila terrae TaxID=2697030 RepID=A0A6P1MKZ8_9FIRM|nr:alpha/beta fold hydrolase [Aminipila terrae]QHI73833.1 alpha/beta fold hydrolase [Aminipila terrae]
MGILVLMLFSALFYGGYGHFMKEKAEVIRETVHIKNIPVIETFIDDGKKKPMIIVQHGFKNKKESTIELANKLAEKGFFVVSPDAYAHGQRTEGALSLVEIIVNTSREYDKLIGAYAKDDRVDIKRLGITGFSMGGCITFHYAVYGKYHPEAIAPTISTPYFEQLIGSNLSRSIYSSKQGLTIAQDENTINHIDQYILDNSPYKDYRNLKDVAVLMQNGEMDQYVNSNGVNMLKDTLSKINPRVTLVMIPETRHQVKPEMINNIVDFMCHNVN